MAAIVDRKELLKQVRFYPLTETRWHDFELLFGEKGACGGCWCMWWKLTRSEFEKNKGSSNKRAMLHLVTSGERPGILVYYKKQPVAWCAVAPREKYPALERSRVLQRVDEKPVWSVVCFFTNRQFRKLGLTVELLRFVVKYCQRQGAAIIEGYPVEPKKNNLPAIFAWTGFVSAFRKAGFREVARRSPTRPIMRYIIKKKGGLTDEKETKRRRTSC